MPGLLDKIAGLESDLAQANKEIKEAQQGAAQSLASLQEEMSGQIAEVVRINSQSSDALSGFLESKLAEVKSEVKEAQQESAESLATLKEEINKVNERFTERLDALIEYHSKGILGKLFGKPRPIDTGLS